MVNAQWPHGAKVTKMTVRGSILEGFRVTFETHLASFLQKVQEKVPTETDHKIAFAPGIQKGTQRHAEGRAPPMEEGVVIKVCLGPVACL